MRKDEREKQWNRKKESKNVDEVREKEREREREREREKFMNKY